MRFGTSELKKASCIFGNISISKIVSLFIASFKENSFNAGQQAEQKEGEQED